MFCSYGCGEEAKYHFKNGKHCCSKSYSKCPAVREKNSRSNKGRDVSLFCPIKITNVNILCENGCGQIARYISKSGKKYCSDNHRKCPINRRKNSNGLKGRTFLKGKDSKLYGRKRPSHSKLMKKNNPMFDSEVKKKHKKSCNTNTYKRNMAHISSKRWESEQYRKNFSDTLLRKGLKLSEAQIGKLRVYYRRVIRYTNRSIKTNFSIINPDNKQIGIGLYNIDHIFSIAEGFKQDIPPEIIGSVVNLQVLPSRENIIKKDDCWITKEELLKRYYNENNI